MIMMKYVLVIGDGMADNPVPALGDKTPLQVVRKDAIDQLARKGIVGSVVNCPKGLPAGSDTAILSISATTPGSATPAVPPWRLPPPVSS